VNFRPVKLERLRAALRRSPPAQITEPASSDPAARAAQQRARESLTEAQMGSMEMHVLAERLRKEREINHFAPIIYAAMKRNNP
jgi:hypothetical protein